MTIKFSCPHCQKMLSVVKEHLAGKKAACPACKQPIAIPAPTAAPADVEALAAAAFTDEPVKKVEAAPQFVEFRCYYCDEQVKVSAEFAGKQAPCPNPECRRIVKVPHLVKQEAKDWRKVDTRTPLVAQRTEPAPEGAWGSTTSAGNVSRRSLEDAAATPAATAPVGTARWLIRGGILVAVLLVGGGGWWGFSAWSRDRVETQALAKAEALLGEDKLQADPLAAGEGWRGAGEYYLRTRKAPQAVIRFQQARAVLSKDELTSRERDFVLADLAASQVDLGGTPLEAEEKVRVKWDDAHKEIVQTLVKIRHRDVRVEAVREVGRRLIARGEGKRAEGIAVQVSSPEQAAELMAVIGLELLAAKLTEDAKTVAELALRRYLNPLPGETPEPQDLGGDTPAKAKDAAARKVPLSEALLALWVALELKDEKGDFPPPPPKGAGERPVLVAGYAEGLSYRGERERARALVKFTTTAGQVQACLALAAATDPPEAARADLEEALNLLEKNLRGKGVPQVTLFRLVRVGVRAGMTETLRPAAAAITDRDLRGRAQLEILRGRLASASERVDESAAQDVEKESPAYDLALAAIVRHNARVDSPKTARNGVDGWESERQRALGYVSVALGSREARK